MREASGRTVNQDLSKETPLLLFPFMKSVSPTLRCAWNNSILSLATYIFTFLAVLCSRNLSLMNFWVSQFILIKSEMINENNGFFKLHCLVLQSIVFRSPKKTYGFLWHHNVGKCICMKECGQDSGDVYGPGRGLPAPGAPPSTSLSSVAPGYTAYKKRMFCMGLLVCPTFSWLPQGRVCADSEWPMVTAHWRWLASNLFCARVLEWTRKVWEV